MKRREDLPDWMWSDALAALDRAERLHRQLFQPRYASTWEPPVDMLETDHEVLIYVALPGVDAHEVQAVIEGAVLVVTGRRTLPPALRTAAIHRLELPQGRFERHIGLPPGRYGAVDVGNERGCLVIRLHKAP
ncbi:Hsp20/alpha crystallin family protein [Comamonas sp. NLF-1-9]|uniref:Hsp20/alpha crystallin family protein n=1 Tax=Comamonas sp. NLF-1-9 TaxID=2853163 RepID=UPI001C4775A8|nr:Hsp20/alpha crystallin family protein [Comamonas sp. NLF-1-9]QXL85002.1 Hsp20/alpha crystallin family protein [Comamonas sp. NLF-1-9]